MSVFFQKSLLFFTRALFKWKGIASVFFWRFCFSKEQKLSFAQLYIFLNVDIALCMGIGSWVNYP